MILASCDIQSNGGEREKQGREGVPQEKERLVKDDQGSDETVHKNWSEIDNESLEKKIYRDRNKQKRRRSRRRGRVSQSPENKSVKVGNLHCSPVLLQDAEIGDCVKINMF
ncbi:hypothetical protein YC2023_106809 [Brassica napus]